MELFPVDLETLIFILFYFLVLSLPVVSKPHFSVPFSFSTPNPFPAPGLMVIANPKALELFRTEAVNIYSRKREGETGGTGVLLAL